MGEVYLGEQVAQGRKVALKVLRQGLHTQREMAERFKREARLLSAVDHPAVVRIIDFGESGDSACLVMELVEGQSLHEALRIGPLPPAKALKALKQLAEGLAAIHDKGIIHRDLKPENVFLTSGPQGEQARLLDFGIARLVEPDPDSHVSQLGVVIGTPEYLSPEQAAGARVDARGDLYSFGVLAYHVLSGRLPFEGPSARHYIAQHVNAAPLRLDRAVPEFAGSPELAALVMRLLEKDPANRLQSAHALAEALTEVAKGPLPEKMKPPVIQRPSTAPAPPAGPAVFSADARGPTQMLPPSVPWDPPRPSPLPPPAGSGTAIFGEGVPVPSPVSPPTSSGTEVFGAGPPVPSPVPAPTTGTAVFGTPALPARSGTAIFGAPSPAPDPEPPGSALPESAPRAQGQPPSETARGELRKLARPARRGLQVAAVLSGLLVLTVGVALWTWSQRQEASAQRFLSPEQAQSLELHARQQHAEEHAVLLALEEEERKRLGEEVLASLMEDFGGNESNRELRELLDAIPKERLHEHLEELAEGEHSPKQWGALRYLEAKQDIARLNLVKQYMKALASEDCSVRAKAARRLGTLGSTDALPALRKLADQKACGREEAAAALQTLTPVE